MCNLFRNWDFLWFLSGWLFSQFPGDYFCINSAATKRGIPQLQHNKTVFVQNGALPFLGKRWVQSSFYIFDVLEKNNL